MIEAKKSPCSLLASPNHAMFRFPSVSVDLRMKSWRRAGAGLLVLLFTGWSTTAALSQTRRIDLRGDERVDLPGLAMLGAGLPVFSSIKTVSRMAAFPWQLLQNLEIDESRSPSATNVRFRPASLWREYKYYVIGGMVIILAQTMTIVALVGHRARRRRAERSLAESEARFRIAADAAPVMFWMAGPDQLCTFLNKPWLEFTGRTADRELGNGWAEGVHSDDRQRCLNTYSEAFNARQRFVMEYRLRQQDGEYRWISDSGSPRFDNQGNFVGYIGTCFDITESRRKTEALTESESRLRAILDTAVEGIITIDQRGIIESVNAAAENIFGYVTAEIVGQPLSLLMPNPFSEDRGNYCQPKILGGNREVSGRRKDGAVFPLDLAVSEIAIANRRVFTCLVRDITERKQAEQAARVFGGRLLHAQEAERARLARELHDDITQRLARLAIDAGRLELGRNGGGDSEMIRELRDGLARLSEDVHSLSYKLHPALLEDLGLPDALRVECERFTLRESVPVKLRLEGLPARIEPDTGLCLFRVTQEALRNVARHARAQSAEVTLRPMDTGLQLAVTDDGTGFDLRQQRPRPSLGLASMRERVRLLEGELDIDSAPGQGTTILVWVPLKVKAS